MGALSQFSVVLFSGDVLDMVVAIIFFLIALSLFSDIVHHNILFRGVIDDTERLVHAVVLPHDYVFRFLSFVLS